MKYAGKELSLEPINISMDEVVKELQHGETVYVILEPGDATRYELLITPLWGWQRRMVPLGEQKPWRWLLVTRMNQSENNHPSIRIQRGFWIGELEPLTRNNIHTHAIFAWWLCKLWAQTGPRHQMDIWGKFDGEVSDVFSELSTETLAADVGAVDGF